MVVHSGGSTGGFTFEAEVQTHLEPIYELSHIPKGQLMRIRCNCKDVNEFNQQADLHIDKFKVKGYKESSL